MNEIVAIIVCDIDSDLLCYKLIAWLYEIEAMPE
jgi:hypothetical protein